MKMFKATLTVLVDVFAEDEEEAIDVIAETDYSFFDPRQKDKKLDAEILDIVHIE